MKKTLVMCAMMLMGMMAYAQDAVKVSPKMKKGDVKEYFVEANTSMGGQTVKMTSNTKYTVVDKLADGYELEVSYTNFNSDAGEDLARRMITMTQQVMEGSTIRLQVDNDGKPIKILNYDEVARQVETLASQMLDELLKTPGLPPMVTKDMLMGQMKAGLSEDMLLNSMLKYTSPLMLNGKNIATGTEEEFFHDMMRMKVKRTYTVNGNIISAKSSLNMSKEDMKNYVISQVEMAMPEQAEAVKQNIDMIINSGMMKVEMDEHVNYELQADGWVKSIKDESNISMMGTQNKVVTTVTLK